MKKIPLTKSLAFFVAYIGLIHFSFGQIVAWEMNGNAGNEATVNATTRAANLNTSTLTRGSGLNPANLANAFSSDDFTTIGSSQANAISNNDYLQFQISASAGYQVSLSTLDVNFRRSGTGPNRFIWQYSTNGTTFTNIGTVISFNDSPTNGNAQTQINLSTIPALQNVVSGTTITIRLYGWGATNSGGTFAIGRLSGNDLSLGGTVSIASVCSSTVTWNGLWTPTTPTISTNVILDASYNTATDGGSFSACSLTINSSGGFVENRLTISDGNYVEVENDVTVDGQLFVETQGNFIQNNDLANFTDNSTNGVLVSKIKTVQNKFVYTYWSSPIIDETIEQVFSTVPTDKRFLFNASNFVDMLEEVGNTGTFLANPGVDDIDDDGNDWQYAVTGPLQPGVGYAMRTNIFGPAFPRPENFVFRGEFNNGVITVPLVNNSGGLYNDWNLVGNPYPCAVDADQFFAVNTGLVDAIYLWDQFTAPSTNASGNEGYNFSGADYAMINGSGSLSGGASGTIPNRFIPSGQGFFVEALNAGDLTFNNSMRSITNDNSQFFKNSNSKKNTSSLGSKLWLNLTSDNGAFNQILVSYLDGASNNNDGSFYDLKRPISTGNKALLYSLIENDRGKFAIQGKDPNSLNEDDIVKLGFATNITVPTLYKLSIAQIQGDFLHSNPVYLKDNLLNTTHDLSASDYSFTSEVGEFNDRFEIGYSAAALSTDEFAVNSNSLRIIELDNNRVQFSASDNLSIQNVSIYDLLGRQLYDLKGRNTTEVYTLSNLSSTIYIAKVALSNGTVITKKAVKK